MNDNRNPESSREESFEREILQGRKFTAEEAMARLAGPGAMSGASPISPQQEAENAAGVWLRATIADSAGALTTVLHRHLKGSSLLLENIDDPIAAARACCQQILASEHRLEEFVREVDVEWGRSMDERPHFERQGIPADADDPYTVESVRGLLREAISG